MKDGKFDTEGITEILSKQSQIPSVSSSEVKKCSGTRALRDNLSDLKAQVAANQKGISLMKDLISEYSLPVVLAYMKHVQKNCEDSVRQVLKELSVRRNLKQPVDSLYASDFMDDGSRIQLKVTIDSRDGSAVFDFTGTSPQVCGNLNAPRAVTYSAVIYCLRCLVKKEIPLNHGLSFSF